MSDWGTPAPDAFSGWGTAPSAHPQQASLPQQQQGSHGGSGNWNSQPPNEPTQFTGWETSSVSSGGHQGNASLTSPNQPASQYRERAFDPSARPGRGHGAAYSARVQAKTSTITPYNSGNPDLKMYDQVQAPVFDDPKTSPASATSQPSKGRLVVGIAEYEFPSATTMLEPVSGGPRRNVQPTSTYGASGYSHRRSLPASSNSHTASSSNSEWAGHDDTATAYSRASESINNCGSLSQPAKDSIPSASTLSNGASGWESGCLPSSSGWDQNPPASQSLHASTICVAAAPLAPSCAPPTFANDGCNDVHEPSSVMQSQASSWSSISSEPKPTSSWDNYKSHEKTHPPIPTAVSSSERTTSKNELDAWAFPPTHSWNDVSQSSRADAPFSARAQERSAQYQQLSVPTAPMSAQASLSNSYSLNPQTPEYIPSPDVIPLCENVPAEKSEVLVSLKYTPQELKRMGSLTSQAPAPPTSTSTVAAPVPISANLPLPEYSQWVTCPFCHNCFAHPPVRIGH